MTDEELDRLATKLAERLAANLAEKMAEKMQTSVMNSIYQDAGKTVFGLLRKAFYGLLIALAAWGIAPHIIDR